MTGRASRTGNSKQKRTKFKKRISPFILFSYDDPRSVAGSATLFLTFQLLDFTFHLSDHKSAPSENGPKDGNGTPKAQCIWEERIHQSLERQVATCPSIEASMLVTQSLLQKNATSLGKNIRTENWWCPFGCALSRLQLLAASVKPGLKQNSSVSPVRQFTEGCLVHGLHPAWFLLALSKMFLTAPERNFLSVWNSHVTCTHQIRHIPALSVFTSISCLPITLRARLWNSLHVPSHQGPF